METLKKSLVVILGVLLISSFVTNVNLPATKTEFSNGEKNIELIKRLMKEKEYKEVQVWRELSTGHLLYGDLDLNSLTFEDIYIIAKYSNNDITYFEAEKIKYIRSNGKYLEIWIQ